MISLPAYLQTKCPPVVPFSYAKKLHRWCVLSLFSRVRLCDPMDCSLGGSSIHGILQARILKWHAMPSSRGSSQSRDRPCISYISCIGKEARYVPVKNSITQEALQKVTWESLASCLSLSAQSQPFSPWSCSLQCCSHQKWITWNLIMKEYSADLDWGDIL